MANEAPTVSSLLARLDRLLVRYEAGLIDEKQLAAQRDTLTALLKAIELNDVVIRLAALERHIGK